ncbi:OTU domain, ubiquitin aldehyde binding [Mortierella claussenii]|nr:OTU domain, ubiquitin aldehyde binding [Mortierella claussenii]
MQQPSQQPTQASEVHASTTSVSAPVVTGAGGGGAGGGGAGGGGAGGGGGTAGVPPVTSQPAQHSSVQGHQEGSLPTNLQPLQQQEVQLTDEQILTQMQAIKDEEANAHPLVDNSVDLTELGKEYENGSAAFRNKIMNLADTHDRMRRSRGDGNCFYRAFAFAWFERVMLAKNRPELHANAVKAIQESKDLLLAAQFELLAFEDFYQVTLVTLENLVQFTPEELLATFQNDEVSNSIVMHFRLMASAYLKTHQEDYAPFLEFGQTMEEYCSMHVEAMGRESEEMMLIALTKATHVSVEVAYLSGNQDADEVNFLPFLPDTAPYMPPLVLLYRPGHYDILYRKSHCLEGVV